MKKIYILFSFFTLFSIPSLFAQTVMTEGFESGFPPTGWTIINAGSGNNWKLNTDASQTYAPYPSRTGAGAATYEFHSTNNANAWMITQGVTLTGGTAYTISFYYRIGQAIYAEKMKVTVGSAATVAAQTTTLWDNNGGSQLTNVAYTSGTATFTPSTSGTYYFGFNAYSDADKFVLMVDDISVEVTPASVPGCATNISPAAGATNVTVPSINFSWNAASGATSYDFYVGTTNPPTSMVTNVSTTNATIVGFATNTTYYWYVLPRNAAGPATGCAASATSFTTENLPAPANNECNTAIEISAYMGGAYNGYTINATASSSIPACAVDPGTPDDDVWFKFTALQNGTAKITVQGASTFDGVLQAFSGACGSLSLVGACTDTSGSGGVENLDLAGLIAGQTYYLRVYDYSSGFGDRFTISVSGIALPVAFAEFTGKTEGNTNILTWNTKTESNNKGFELQRSADGKNYSTIANIASKAENGNSTTQLNYQYADASPLGGTNFYRLKQFDFDGKFSYSNIVTLKNKVSDIRITSVYPNPTRNELNLVISSPSVQRSTIIVTDLTGKVIRQRATQLVAGDNLQQFNIQSLSSGTYLVKLVCDNGCESAVQRFVKY